MSAAVVLACLVVAVADGDTLTCLSDDRQQIHVRLVEIDAPESKQAFGAKSKQALSDLCFQVHASIRSAGTDQYGRTLGRVTCNGVDANAEMVRSGMAWVYDRYVTDRSLYALQDEAKAARRGLWSEPAPIPPWDFRRQGSAASPSNTGSKVSSVEVRGNKNSGIYHVPGCRNYDDVSLANRVIFKTEDDAKAAGYRKAGNCR